MILHTGTPCSTKVQLQFVCQIRFCVTDGFPAYYFVFIGKIARYEKKRDLATKQA